MQKAKNGLGGGSELNFSGPLNRMGETLSYEVGANLGSMIGQAHGIMGPSRNTHGLSTKIEERRIGFNTIIGIKFTVNPIK
ncbi:MAG: hypothetical protein IPM47_14875 [Sphingobacteriales bacterium]|nr:MAG: hypothetical protein IPM47_14875 [Sphingobacteriales bacterium]